jgi:hypothetical protein
MYDDPFRYLLGLKILKIATNHIGSAVRAITKFHVKAGPVNRVYPDLRIPETKAFALGEEEVHKRPW